MPREPGPRMLALMWILAIASVLLGAAFVGCGVKRAIQAIHEHGVAP